MWLQPVVTFCTKLAYRIGLILSYETILGLWAHCVANQVLFI